jgi:hypothetical protein
MVGKSEGTILVNEKITKKAIFYLKFKDGRCGLVARVPGYRSRGLGSNPDTTRFF